MSIDKDFLHKILNVQTTIPSSQKADVIDNVRGIPLQFATSSPKSSETISSPFKKKIQILKLQK